MKSKREFTLNLQTNVFGKAWHLLIRCVRNPLLSSRQQAPFTDKKIPNLWLSRSSPPLILLCGISLLAHTYSHSLTNKTLRLCLTQSTQQPPSGVRKGLWIQAARGSLVCLCSRWDSLFCYPFSPFRRFILFISHLRRLLPAARQPSLFLTFFLLRPALGENPAVTAQI